MKRKILSCIIATVLALAGMTACAPQNGGSASGSSAQEAILPDYTLDDLTVEEAGSPVTLGTASFVGMKATNGDFTMYYRIYIPEERTEALPVMLFFHGVGESGSDNRAPLGTYDGFQELFNDATSPIYNSIVLVPQCPSSTKWVDVASTKDGQYSTDELEESTAVQTALKILKLYSEQVTIDKSRIYAMGMSMGGFATWDLLIRHTDLIAAAIPMCGGCDTSKYELLLNKPIYTFHGSADPLIPVTGTREMYRLLTEAGSTKITYVEYEGAMHDIWNRAMRTEGLMTWLYSQSL